MKIGVSIPRLPDAEGIREFCQRAERLGFESVMAGDHIVLPVGGDQSVSLHAHWSVSTAIG